MPDPFVERYLKTAGRTSAVRHEPRRTVRPRCACSACPTYTDCAANNGERLFCERGYSNLCITCEVDCLCARGCPVHRERRMRHAYYCMRGSETAQRYECEVWGIRS